MADSNPVPSERGRVGITIRSNENMVPAAALVIISVSKSSIRRFVITEKAPTRAFSWLKAATTAFTFKTLRRRP